VAWYAASAAAITNTHTAAITTTHTAAATTNTQDTAGKYVGGVRSGRGVHCVAVRVEAVRSLVGFF